MTFLFISGLRKVGEKNTKDYKLNALQDLANTTGFAFNWGVKKRKRTE